MNRAARMLTALFAGLTLAGLAGCSVSSQRSEALNYGYGQGNVAASDCLGASLAHHPGLGTTASVAFVAESMVDE